MQISEETDSSHDVNRGSERAVATAGRIAVMVGVTVLLSAFVGIFSGEKLRFLYKDILGLSASEVATLGILLGIPSYLRPFMGIGADLFPLGGYHRRSYYAVSWLLMSAGYAALALTHHYHYGQVAAMVILAAAGGNMMFVVTDAVMVSIGNRTGTIGRLQTIQQGLPLLITLTFGGYLAGYVTQHWSYMACFLTAAALCLLGTPLALGLPDLRVVASQQSHESAEAHAARMTALRDERQRIVSSLKEAVRSPGLWAVVGFVFYLIITPGTNTAQFYYSVDILHFSKQFLGTLSAYGSGGAIVGILLFLWLSRRLPVKAMVWGAFLMDCSIYLVSMALHNHPTGIAVAFVSSLTGSLYNLCLLTIAARACPPKIEATVYGLVMAAIYLAANLGEKMGATMYDDFGPVSHHSIAHGWHTLLWVGFGFTVIAAVFIPFLPAWARSNEPLRPKAAAA